MKKMITVCLVAFFAIVSSSSAAFAYYDRKKASQAIKMADRSIALQREAREATEVNDEHLNASTEDDDELKLKAAEILINAIGWDKVERLVDSYEWCVAECDEEFEECGDPYNRDTLHAMCIRYCTERELARIR